MENLFENTVDLRQLEIKSMQLSELRGSAQCQLNLELELAKKERELGAKDRELQAKTDVLAAKELELEANKIELEVLNETQYHCVICSEKYGEHITEALVSCGLVYHQHCLRAWLRLRTICPTCNRSTRSGVLILYMAGGTNQVAQVPNPEIPLRAYHADRNWFPAIRQWLDEHETIKAILAWGCDRLAEYLRNQLSK